MVSHPPRTAAAFQRWLDGLPEDGVAGTRASCTTCPLAAWLDALGGVGAEVHREGWTSYTDERLRPLPDWAAQFLEHVDHAPGEEVTVRECRAAMVAVGRWLGS